MAFFDLPEKDLREYRPDLVIPGDFDDFWRSSLEEAQRPPEVSLTRCHLGLVGIEVFDVTFAGFGSAPIKAWLTRPVTADPVPAVVEFVGYGGGRGLPHEHLRWAVTGRAHLIMDTRGQGSVWGTGGGTGDPIGPTGPTVPGLMTRGIEDPAHHYYRRVYLDGVHAVAAVRGLPGIDPDRVSLTGGSQGGGIALAVAGLVPDVVAVMPDVPFLCHVARAITITDAYPFHELVDYLHTHRDAEEMVLRTWSYLDAAHLATRAKAPALFSAALMDQVCPPSTIFAAFNHYGHPEGSRIDVYRYNGHEGGEGFRWSAQRAFLDGLGA